jgi:hypothetical protein
MHPALSRSVLAAALLLCVLASALPAAAVSNPYSSMPCCRGMMISAGYHGNSCPLHRARAKSPKLAQNDPVCGAAGHDLQAKGKAVPVAQAPSQHVRPHDHAQVEVEHDQGRGVSPQNTSSRQQSAEDASIGRLCPSNCCGTATGSFTGLRRPRHGAALTNGLRPRPSIAGSRLYISSGIINAASALRRNHPPRPPPTALISCTA